MAFSDAYPSTIDQGTFPLVKTLYRARYCKYVSGLLYCADCGSKLGYKATNNYKREQAFFFCSSYRKVSNLCTAHFIREDVLAQLVLEGLQRLLWYIQVYEKQFDQEQMEGLRQAVQGFLYGEGPPPTSRSSNAGASWIRSQPSCRKEPRIRCRAKVRSLDSPYEGGAKSGAAFSIQKLLVSLGLRHFFRYVW